MNHFIAQTTASYKAWLQRPLITGASVSADFGSPSPGKRLAKRFTNLDQVRTLAFPGRPGREIMKSLGPEALHDRSIVLAVDLFFWDSTLSDTAPTIKALQALMTWVKDANLPIVLGNIPELLAGRQPQRATLNSVIRSACEAYPRCYTMPFVRLHQKALSEGGLMIRGRRYTLRELVPDGLHLSEAAGDYLADVIMDLILGQSRGQGVCAHQ